MTAEELTQTVTIIVMTPVTAWLCWQLFADWRKSTKLGRDRDPLEVLHDITHESFTAMAEEASRRRER